MPQDDIQGIHAQNISVQAGTVLHLEAVAGWGAGVVFPVPFRKKDGIQILGRDGKITGNARIILVRGKRQRSGFTVVTADGTRNGVFFLCQDKVCLCIPVFGHGFGAQGDGGKGQFADGQGHVPFHLEAEGVSL